MDVKKSLEALIKPIAPQQTGKTPHGIVPNPVLEPQLPKIKLDRDRMEFQKRDKDWDGALTSDEYGVGKRKQDEFRRYDTNNDGKVDLKEFKRGRLLDRLTGGPHGRIRLPEPTPLPKPVPMPMPHLPGAERARPMPMPFLPNEAERGRAVPLGGSGTVDLADLLAKVKAAQKAQDF